MVKEPRESEGRNVSGTLLVSYISPMNSRNPDGRADHVGGALFNFWGLGVLRWPLDSFFGTPAAFAAR
jgi:hypothetical protein